MQAYYVRFLNPTGTELTWILVRDETGSGITPELIEDFAETIVTAHGNDWRYPNGKPKIGIQEVRHLDRCMITIGTAEAARSRLAGGFGGGIYRRDENVT